MKTFFKWFIVIVWAVVVGVGGYFLANLATREEVHSGTTVKFSADTSHFLLIDSESVQFEGASSEFFVLRKLSGETIVPIPVAPPLGWVNDTYFSFGPTQIPGGKWYVGVGNPTIQITSEGVVKVQVVVTEYEKNSKSAGAILISLIVWGLGFVVLGMVGFFDW